MYLELEYYGQNDGTTVPDLTLTGDPGVDNPALTAAGYTSGAICSIKAGGATTSGLIIHPCDGKGTEAPYGFLLLGAGQFSSAITPSGSGKTPIVRAFPKFKVPAAQCQDATWSNYATGAALYCGISANGANTATAGLFAHANASGTAGANIVGYCTHTPTTAEPWLGVASVL